VGVGLGVGVGVGAGVGVGVGAGVGVGFGVGVGVGAGVGVGVGTVIVMVGPLVVAVVPFASAASNCTLDDPAGSVELAEYGTPFFQSVLEDVGCITIVVPLTIACTHAGATRCRCW
jgi:hypothetical protein